MSSYLRPFEVVLNKFSTPNSRAFSLSLTLFAGITILPLTGFVGCTGKSAPNSTPEVSASNPKEVSLAIWANYLSPEMQEKFTKETGIKLKVSNFSSSEELLAKAQAGASGVDVAVPSDYMVGVMAKTNLLLPIESAKIPNRSGLDPALMNREFDPDNHFSLPYSWTLTGIAVNRSLYKGKIKSWKDLFTNADLAGKVSLLDDAREVTAAALKMNGFSVNTLNPDELAKAEATLKEMRPRVKMFTSDVIDPLIKKEIAVAQGYSSDILQAAKAGDNQIEFVLPEEGGTRAIDNLVIFKSSKHIEEAHKLINFLLSTPANVAFVNAVRGGPVVLKTKAELSPELAKNPILFPTAGSLSKFEFLHDVGEATRLYDRLWTEVRAE